MTRLWAKSPCAHQIAAPPRPSSRVRSQPLSALEVADPAFGAGAPLDEPAEPPRMFGVPAGGRDLGFARDGDRANPERLQVSVCGGLAVTSVGGDRTRHAAGAPPDPADSRRLQGGGSASPEITARSQTWTARTTSSGPGTARGVAEPAIQSEITVMRARNWPSASIEARMTKILVRRAGLASSGICRSSGSEHH